MTITANRAIALVIGLALIATACSDAGQALELRMQPGYDHSYYFVQTFMGDHIAHHAGRLV